ncbi:hypothetical protein RchiOBHm_Chr1g0316551 [Rosa chinensis]|uniref:Uncharacterized protein n=1 Tax=Rosa chinensis TaxID=74649 RepID=A0A2P6S7N3_ROSCH|nr:uncharacterized protein LOC112188916 [Rosa chinensis]XP_024183931.1 uncharacterized protein LOC112188916 [Rosa chinensis]PRQ54696.1 hypothetical protein RchiOBHm_Chr1g0316551 [Rosa chinensis]
MASIQQYSEPSIEDAFAIRPLSKRNLPHRIPSFRRDADTVSASLSTKQTVSGTIHSSCPAVSSATASVHDSPSSLIPTASIKCTSIEEGFGTAPIPGDNEALILDSFIQGVVDDAPGSVSVDQTVAVKCHKNVSSIVGRERERQESNFDHGSMIWFCICFKRRLQA